MSLVKGDRFRAKSTGIEGTIEDISYNSIYAENEYYVQWDNRRPGNIFCYSEREALSEWVKVDDRSLPLGFIGYNVDVSQPIISKKSCDHKWVNVGFQFAKFVCSNCNEEQK